MKRGHRLRRSCLGCGERDERGFLMRLVVLPGDRLERVERGAGRGGYLHAREKCWEAFLRRRSLHRAFRVEVGRQSKERLVRALREESVGARL